MSARKPKTKIVIVEWFDAYSSPEHEQMKGDKGIPTISVGILSERTRHGIRMAQMGHVWKAGGLDLRGEHFIPSGMIHKVTTKAL